MTGDINLTLSELKTMVTPPSGIAPRADWPEVEDAVGFQLPTDYRRLVDEYGGGYIDDYLYLLEPRCRNQHYDLAEAAAERTEALQYLWDGGEARPPELEARTEARVFPWATTDNGEALYWLAIPGTSPDDWVVMVNEARGPEWERFDIGCLEFLVNVLSGRITSDILWSRFPTSPHSFHSIPALQPR